MDPFEAAALQLLQQLSGEQQAAAQQATLDTVLAAVNAVLVLVRQVVSDIVDPVTGLAAIQGQLATLQATTALDFTAVLTAIAATQQSGSPVTLPSSPPSAYIAPSSASNANAVWNALDGISGDSFGLTLGKAAKVIRVQDLYGSWPDPYSDVFWIQAVQEVSGMVFFNTDTPQPDPANILSTDTLVSWLTRELSAWTVDTSLYGPGTIAVYQSGNPLQFFNRWSDADFRGVQASMFPAVTSALPPIWPGLGGVTLGTPVSLSDGLVLTGPLSGLLIDITAVAPPVSFYPFGTIKSYVRAGAVVFTTDNGDSEFPQPFGPEDEVILPKSMSEADSATLRVTSGIVGTVTPFTIP